MAKETSTPIYEQIDIHNLPSSKQLLWLKQAIETAGEECCEWPFYKTPKGYGRVCFKNSPIRAHRLVCYWVHGRPENHEMHAAHSCGNPKCVNPKHLRWALPHDNEQDKSTYKTLPGEHHWCAKMDVQTVVAIRKMVSEGVSRKKAAERAGVSLWAVSDIVNKRTWRWLE